MLCLVYSGSCPRSTLNYFEGFSAGRRRRSKNITISRPAASPGGGREASKDERKQIMKPSFFLTIAAAAIAVSISAGSAEAGQRYCREYTKTIRVGGQLQSGYGTACMQPDGSWELVSYNGQQALYDDVLYASRRGNGRVVRVERRPVSYWYQPYCPPRSYYRPSTVFSFSFGDHDRRRHGRRWHDDDHHYHGRGHR